MQHILSTILIIALGFFPFMPVMHAEESYTRIDSHSMEASGCCHDCTEENAKNTETHDMEICLKAVYDIAGQIGIVSPEPQTSLISIFPFWKDIPEIHSQKYIRNFSKSQDPPFFESHHLVGIVKLII